MRRSRVAAACAFLVAALFAASASAQATLRVTVPAGTPEDAAVYVAGGFNGWNPADSLHRLARQGDGTYAITLHPDVRGAISFKFTQGGWDRVETDSAMADVPNRTFTVPATGAATYEGTVVRWRDGSARPVPASTRTASVTILDTAFAIPQLGRTRRVWIYLPPDYASSARRYPVLYLHDGQNVFDAATAFSGEWGVDESLDSLHAAGIPVPIVVAVDNGGDRRLDEYSPWRNPRYGGGEGDEYVDWIVGDLKPFIDRTYRTLPDPDDTGVMGSSMGGLISMYAIRHRPDVFGRAGVFSPAFWFSDSTFVHAGAAGPPRPGTRVYMLTGAREGDDPAAYVRGHRAMADTLAAAGFVDGLHLVARVADDGEHAEWFWRREFPRAVRWLFADAGDASPAPPPDPDR